MIEVQGLRKYFGSVAAVRDVSFAALDGRITGLLGPNGAGKSTTLRILSTLLEPDAGGGRIDSLDLLSDPLGVRRLIGVLPHSSGIYPNLTGRENIDYFGRLQGLDALTIERRTRELVELLEMGDFVERRAKGYSQGQRLKVAIARALVHSPRNVVLDEPTNGLDVMATRALRSLLRRLRDEGHCVLFSSHVMQEVANLCDEVVIIARGQVVARGTPDQIRTRSSSDSLEDAFVAAIGSAEGLQ
jgi:sodium transport system ATP-binding protein